MNRKLMTTTILLGLLSANAADAKTLYLIDVNVDGVPAYSDCLELRDDGTLSLGKGRLALHWLDDPLVDGGFVATTEGGDRIRSPARLAMHGTVIAGRFVTGNAVNDYGLAYTFAGRKSDDCAGAGGDDPDAAHGMGKFSGVPIDVFAPEPTRHASTDGSTTTRPGSKSAVADRSYRVFLNIAGEPASMFEECWTFVRSGELLSDSGNTLLWRMDESNTDETTFQSVATRGARHGTAFHGHLAARDELEVSGIKAFRTRTVAYHGRAIPVAGC